MSFLCQNVANSPSIVVAFVISFSALSSSIGVHIWSSTIYHSVLSVIAFGGIMFNTQYLSS